MLIHLFYLPPDEIFDGLKRLYGDESDNESLRAEIQEKIKQRLDVVNGMSGNAKDTSDNLVVAIRNINDAQEWAKKVGVDLAKQTTVDRLRRCHEGESDAQEEFESDVLALERLKGIIAKQNMQDDSSASLVDLQLAVGAAFDIAGDLAALTEYITNNTEPGPGPLLNLEQNELLEMWSDLAVEVQKFKDNFIGAERERGRFDR
ncbi:hypothetical protein N7516_003692 [Penicillium verrucosum]|uniref:uncharacterized protein n=1 Tax=Penicillium verrucosum TaxID=60171 RepID=UPI002545393A|nr:uncharacterized protein N7516_003692 [Penicillium verrucosum]KAJ5943524.1 hypothetical protein N7516_003692 [Penicillium verrucosum]